MYKTHRNNKSSKSTKRRRLLDEQYLHEHLFEIDNVPLNEPFRNIITSSDGINCSTDLVVTDINEPSSSNRIELNPVIDYGYDLLEESANDSSGTNSEFEFTSQQQSLTSKL